MNDKMIDKDSLNYPLRKHAFEQNKGAVDERKNVADEVKIKYEKIFCDINCRNVGCCFHLYFICVSDQTDDCG